MQMSKLKHLKKLGNLGYIDLIFSISTTHGDIIEDNAYYCDKIKLGYKEWDIINEDIETMERNTIVILEDIFCPGRLLSSHGHDSFGALVGQLPLDTNSFEQLDILGRFHEDYDPNEPFQNTKVGWDAMKGVSELSQRLIDITLTLSAYDEEVDGEMLYELFEYYS
jgi:hypothetical protein